MKVLGSAETGASLILLEAASKAYEQRAAEPIYSGKIQAMLQFLLAKQLPNWQRQAAANQRWTEYQHAVAVMLQRVQCGRTQVGEYQNTH